MCALRDAWLALLALALPSDAYKRVLVRLHDLVIPHFSNPLLLCDFLTASLDQGMHWAPGLDMKSRPRWCSGKGHCDEMPYQKVWITWVM